MIAHLVSLGLQFGDQFGILFCPETDEKEIGFDPVLIQNIEDSLCIRASPCRVKADGEHFFLCIYVIHRSSRVVTAAIRLGLSAKFA